MLWVCWNISGEGLTDCCWDSIVGFVLLIERGERRCFLTN